MKQGAAELRLELLDRGGEGGLRDVTELGRAREPERLRRCKEIPHLMHFHESPLSRSALRYDSAIGPKRGLWIDNQTVLFSRGDVWLISASASSTQGVSAMTIYMVERDLKGIAMSD